MRYITFVVMKLKPEYWQLIKSGEKTIEIRDEKPERCSGIIFTDPQTGEVLGAARIKTLITLYDWTPQVIAKLASITEQEATELFGKHMNKKKVKNVFGATITEIGNDPLYAIEIEPCPIEQLIQTITEDAR